MKKKAKIAFLQKQVIFHILRTITSFHQTRPIDYFVTLTVFIYFQLDYLIASRALDGCSSGSYGCEDDGCPSTCFCEDHCSWRKCKLTEPPQSCVKNSRRIWIYDQRRNYWKTAWAGILMKLPKFS